MTEILWTRPEGPSHATFVFAHGAGAGMDSNFMERFATAAAANGLSVARFEFDYMAKRRVTGKKAPPPRADKLVGEYQRAVQMVAEQSEGAILIGGKSMGCRVAAMLAGSGSVPKRVTGIVCLGYPFHPSGKPEPENWRLQPLQEAKRPVLVLQGDRDQFGSQSELAEVTLPEHVSLTYLEDGNHDLAPRGASPATWDGNIKQAAEAAATFALSLTPA
ncbi:alpha/beta hydrolase [Pseudovibrio exalbescens]|uniref:alpha/beta family hydrolase n=1 Tax=Pseudovibrio exalbescens TaxID=197461 RepID=UPI002365D0B3|nr:alpha/beta family hydrolase [Pseudovibrio exalbescens]MDD7911159.1 alpha/beta hydrolase [Pseudovibrio exalbescens]